MASPYKRPPITEAVIEVQFASSVEKESLEKLQKRLLEDYPVPPLTEFLVEFEVSDTVSKAKQVFAGYRLTSGDSADVVVIGPGRIGHSRLPPYQGWESFVERARRNWDIWKRIVGWQPIKRIGVRYVNRIDIPNVEESLINLEEYLTVAPQLPQGAGLPPMNHFAVNVQVPLGIGNFKVILNVGSMPSPLVKTTSFLLDVDVSLDSELPTADEPIWAVIGEMREYKNRIFEASITDKTRALFG